MARVGVMNFHGVAMQMLKEYGDEVVQDLQEIIPDAADIAVKMIRKDSKKRTGAYARDWAKKCKKARFTGSTWVVYNRKHYRVAHLLEKDHMFKAPNGKITGSWKGDGVIQLAEEYTDAWIESELIKRIGGGD